MDLFLKKYFLNGKFPGVTEMLGKKFKTKKIAMLIYNKKLSVCPITTHLPLKLVSKKLSKNLIIEKIILVNNFYKKMFKYKPKIAVLGLNPHCESFNKIREDEIIIKGSPIVIFIASYSNKVLIGVRT